MVWPVRLLNRWNVSSSSGADPETSVVDTQCRVHGVDNLYIADASIMPTSGGVNPSLTIAANALRIAEVIAARISETRERATS
jgi:choline dehydrogenase-like flavoprotein